MKILSQQKAFKVPKNNDLTFSCCTTAASFWCDELPPQFGKTCFEQTQVVSCGLVPLRPGHLQNSNNTSVRAYTKSCFK